MRKRDNAGLGESGLDCEGARIFVAEQ